MLTIDGFAAVPDRWRGSFLAIGNFDGVHRGHAALIGLLGDRARALGKPAIALTFDPHPAAILRPQAAPAPLTWTERTVALLLEAGADEVGVFRTGKWLLDLTAREFFDRVIREQFGALGMVEGPTFGFGRDRGGDAAILAAWCAGAGMAFETAPPTRIDGRIVSSSRIRAALEAGDVHEAATLLGRPHRLRGEVTAGAGRGAGLGFPTANLRGIDTQVPADGVYAARVILDDRPHPAAAHIGANATFGESSRSVEVHLLDFNGNLYGSRLEVDLIQRLRGTRRFDGADALVAQVRTDLEAARRALAADHPE